MTKHGPLGLFVLAVCGLTGLAQVPEPRPNADADRPRPLSSARLANAADVRKRLGLGLEYENIRGLEDVKVAVLDYGFDGLDANRSYLPEGSVIVEHYDPELVRRFNLGDPEYRKAFAPNNSHGRAMAQMVWAMTGFHPKGPKFYLLNANGPTMLRRAVRYAIEQKVDIILFCGNFEGGGNGDGRGPINRTVTEALAADIIWINAAGNHARRVYNGPVQVHRDSYLWLGADGQALRFKNLLDENTITLTLTWNDYREEEDAGTDKDLDLYVEDWRSRRLGSAEKVQINGPKEKEAGPDESRNPRERVVLTDLAADKDYDYRIRVRAKRGQFTAADRVRVLLTASRETYVDPQTGNPSDAVVFRDASGKGEIFPPADHPLVLTVGETGVGSSAGPTSDHRVKPDVLVDDARAVFSNGDVSGGTSNAAAYFAGVVAVMKAVEPGLKARHVFRLARETGTLTPVSTAGTPTYGAAPRQPESVPRPTTSQYPNDRVYPPGLDPLRPPPSYDPRLSSRNYSLYFSPNLAYGAWPGGAIIIDPYALRGYVGDRRYTMDRPNPPPTRPATPTYTDPRAVPAQTTAQSIPRVTVQQRVWRTPTRAQLAAVVRGDR